MYIVKFKFIYFMIRTLLGFTRKFEILFLGNFDGNQLKVTGKEISHFEVNPT